MATSIFLGGATKTACAGTFTIFQSDIPASVWATGLCSSDCDIVLQRTNCTTITCTGVTQYAACAVVNLRKQGWNTRPINLPGIYKINKPCVSCAAVNVFLSKGTNSGSV